MAKAARQPLTEAQKELVAVNLGLAYAEARRWQGDRQDLLDAALDGLVRGAQCYDPEMGFRFSTYATKVIRCSIQNAYRTSRQFKRRPTGKMLSIDHEGFDVVDPTATTPDLDEFDKTISSLRALDREVLTLRFREQFTLAETGERLGVSKQRVYQIEKHALAKLRDLGRS